MFNTYITEYFNTLLTNFPINAQNNAVGLVSAVLAYIPIHFLLKWLVGEKNSRIAFIAYLATLGVTLTGFLVGV